MALAPPRAAHSSTPPHPPSTQSVGHLLIALGIITLIGSLVAIGALHPQMGVAAFAVGGCGIALTSLPLLGGGYYYSIPSPAVQSECQTISLQAYRAQIYRETLAASQNGYVYGDSQVTIDNQPMLDHACSYDSLSPLDSPSPGHRTQFSVVADDTFNVLLALAREGKNPVGINMANRYKAGGGVERGCSAQEEALCRRSNHILGLRKFTYPLPELGGIYCPHVQVFRKDEAQGYAFMPQPQEVALVAVAAYDLRAKSKERSVLSDENVYADNTKAKIRNMLRIMALKEHTHLVLGALGCGAFQNDPKIIAGFFNEVFREEEFKGRFETVCFAILNQFPRDQRNIDAFTTICAPLTATAFFRS